ITAKSALIVFFILFILQSLFLFCGVYSITFHAEIQGFFAYLLLFGEYVHRYTNIYSLFCDLCAEIGLSPVLLDKMECDVIINRVYPLAKKLGKSWRVLLLPIECLRKRIFWLSPRGRYSYVFVKNNSGGG
ncbi:MAG: hypothetical protein RSC76_00530, partial [Oscillospiraceae bacterium]